MIFNPARACTLSGRIRHTSPVRSSHRLAVVLAIIAALFFPAHQTEAEQQIQLPIDGPLTEPRIELDLTDARIRIVVEPNQAPRLAARVDATEVDADVILEATRIPGSVTLLRRPQSEGRPPMIVVDITLSEEQHLVVVGTRLDIEVSGSEKTVAAEQLVAPPQPQRPQSKTPSSNSGDQPSDLTPGIVASVTDSRINVRHLRDFSLTAERATIDLADLRGLLTLDLRESGAHIRGHLGRITLDAVDSETTIEGSAGRIAVDISGGHLKVSESRSAVAGEIATADIEFGSVSGAIQLTGEESSIRITDAPKSSAQITGSDLRVSLNDIGGNTRVNISRGRLDADLISGRIDLHLSNDAEAGLRDIRGDFAANLTDGARAEVDGVTGHTRIQLQDGELDLRNLKSLELDAVRGSIIGSGIRALTRVNIADSVLDFSLLDIAGRPKIVLRGSSEAQVQLPSPCRVVAKMPASPLGDQLRVSGCHLDFDGARKKGIRNGLDGRPPTVLSATMDDTATLRVDGTP